jgi:putative two-component system response regulator
LTEPAATVRAEAPARVLAVDDQPENLELLGAILGDEGYEVCFAADGEQALAEVERSTPHAVLLDIMMPRLDGLEVCRRMKRQRPTCFTPVVMLTALSDVDSKVRGFEAGADDFLNKPFHRLELLARLRSLLRIRGLRDELDSTEAVLFSMVELLEGKDARTRHHSLRVAAVAAGAARALGVGARALHDLVLGAALHDLGKIGVPEEILRAAGSRSLGDDELALYRSHVELGARILEPIPSLAGALPIVRQHHERRDGSGYPRGQAGDALQLPSEIVAAANALDGARIAAAGGGPEPERWLRQEAERGRFRASVVEAVIGAAAAARPAPALETLLPAPVVEPGGSILVADDSASNRSLYRELLEGSGFATVLAASGGEAIEAWHDVQPDLMILDVRMPGLSGDAVCRVVKADPASAFLPVVLVTAYEESGARGRAMSAGADDLLISPVNRLELMTRVRSLLRLKLYHQDLVRHESVVLSLSAALEAKDPSTRGHSQRVGELAARLARQLELPAVDVDRMRTAGMLHDIGKVGVPERLLHKPGRLDPEEWRAVMAHPQIGFDICKRLRSAREVLDCIRFHHERFDGKGYPSGLAGAAIPFPARVLAVADAYDALTSERAYRRSLAPSEAIGLLARETRDGKWDPRVFDALAILAGRGETALRA